MDLQGLSGQNLSGFGPASAQGPIPRPENRPAPKGEAVSQGRAPVKPEEAKEKPPAKQPDPPKAPTPTTGVRLHVDEGTDRIVAQIVDETNRVIKQIPPEELLEIAANFRRLTGLLFDREV